MDLSDISDAKVGRYNTPDDTNLDELASQPSSFELDDMDEEISELEALISTIKIKQQKRREKKRLVKEQQKENEKLKMPKTAELQAQIQVKDEEISNLEVKISALKTKQEKREKERLAKEQEKAYKLRALKAAEPEPQVPDKIQETSKLEMMITSLRIKQERRREEERLAKEQKETNKLNEPKPAEPQPQMQDEDEKNSEIEALIQVIRTKQEKRREEERLTKEQQEADKLKELQPTDPQSQMQAIDQQLQLAKKENVPLINTYKMNVKDLIQLCKSAIGNNFIIKRLSNDKHAIQCFTMEQHTKIKSLLKESKTEYYSFTSKKDKCKTVILKGLVYDTDPVTLLEELRSLPINDLEFIGVKLFSTVSARRKPLFLVQLSPTSNLDSLRNITVLDCHAVSWDKLKKRGDVFQCMRCQRFGHAAANCQMQSRCVKCSKNHNFGECELGQGRVKDKTQLKCALCGGKGHPASYRGCPTFQQLKIQKLRVVERRTVLDPAPVAVLPQISYAEIAEERPTTTVQRQPQPRVDEEVSVPILPVGEADVMSVLLAIQNQLTTFQNRYGN